MMTRSVKALRKDPAHDQEEALKDIYRRLRPGDPPTVANARALLKRLFFDPKKYDLGRVGRYKINQKLGINVDSTERILTDKDFIAAIKYLINLRRGEGTLDDIDHLGSRRVRNVGELLANQCRVGLARTERLVKGANDSLRHQRGWNDATKAHQSQSSQRGHKGFLRSVTAVAIHGSDESARRIDAQAAFVRSRPRRSEPLSAPALKCATFIRRTTAVFVRSRRPKALTLA